MTMYKMTSRIKERMVPHNECIVQSPFITHFMARGTTTLAPPKPSLPPVKPVRLVKTSRKKCFPYICHVVNCDEKFLNSKGLDAHMQLHLGVKPFVCPVCGKVCQTESKLKAHQNSHANDGVKPVCDICERNFSSRSSLTKHKKIIHKPKPHICPECHSGFEEHRYMVIHAKQAHGLNISLESSNPDSSSVVNFNSSNSNSNEVVTNSKNVTKDDCAVTVSSRDIDSGSYSHESKKRTIGQTNTESLSYREVNNSIKCEFCTSTFPSVAYLEQHRAVHVNEKSLSCSMCNLEFICSQDLADHVKLHGTVSNVHIGYLTPSDTKSSVFDKYTCSVCKENFINLGSLKRHQAKGQCIV